MTKATMKITLERGEIELFAEGEKVNMWVYNKAIQEHVSISFNRKELVEITARLMQIYYPIGE